MDPRPILMVLAAALLWGAAAGAAEPTESPDGPEHVKVYYTEPQALEKVFAGADSLWTETWTPTDEEHAEMQRRLGWRLAPGPVVFHRAVGGGRDLGTAVVTEQKGRFKPITFLVHVQADGRVGQVLVMVYRESRGDGVRRGRFLKQFRGKSGDDPLRLNRDLVHISGATLSSRALAAGVKKVLVQLELHRAGADR